MDISIPFENGDVFFSSIERMIKMGGIVYGKRFCGILPNQKASIERMIKMEGIVYGKRFCGILPNQKAFCEEVDRLCRRRSPLG
jgi:hypothetical protein